MSLKLKLVDLIDALPRIAIGEQPFEYETSDHNFRILAPGCSFGACYLKRCKVEGRYADTIEEAHEDARVRGVTVTGAWFLK